MPDPIHVAAANLDLSGRVAQSVAVSASPAAAAETTIATVTISDRPAILTGVLLWAWAAFTVGTAGTSARLRIRQTNVTGAVVADSGATTAGIAAAALATLDAGGTDTAAVGAQVYVVTLQIASATAGSAVSGVQLIALVV